MHTSYETHQPVELVVDIAKGSVTLAAEETSESTVEVTGDRADEVQVDLTGHRLTITAPKTRTGFFGGEPSVHVRVTVPTGSALLVRTGSADISAQGAWDVSQVRSGSGSIDLDTILGQATVDSGSGDVRVQRLGDAARIKSGSGDVSVGETGSSLSVSAGSGDVEIGRAAGPTAVKTGSGDVRVATSDGDAEFSTGSGDVLVTRFNTGRFQAKGASGDIAVGVPRGIPVWTDVSSLAGQVRSDLEGAGTPAEGQPHIELRAKTASGDIMLKQL